MAENEQNILARESDDLNRRFRNYLNWTCRTITCHFSLSCQVPPVLDFFFSILDISDFTLLSCWAVLLCDIFLYGLNSSINIIINM